MQGGLATEKNAARGREVPVRRKGGRIPVGLELL